jgi:hypothetical protein
VPLHVLENISLSTNNHQSQNTREKKTPSHPHNNYLEEGKRKENGTSRSRKEQKCRREPPTIGDGC